MKVNIDAGTALLTLAALRVGHAGRAILPPLSAAVRAGETWALVGRNGGGKTTLLQTLLGLLPAVSGRALWTPGARASHVEQRGAGDAQVPGRVLDVVRGGVDRGWSFVRPLAVRAARPAVERALADCDLHPLARRPFAALSEGQKQRALIARALVSDPGVLVLDEPTSAMDPGHERALFDLLDALRSARGLAVVIASHQMSLMLAIATHAVFVDADEGVAIAGEVAAVRAAQPFRNRYGDTGFDACDRPVAAPLP